jgi:NAD-dependent dihydropyrimidine dehydrogenase PreA subunit
MPAKVNAEECTGCAACVDSCPCDSIEVPNGVAVVKDNCEDCGACEGSCPTGAISLS